MQNILNQQHPTLILLLVHKELPQEILHIGDQHGEVNIIKITEIIRNIFDVDTILVPEKGLSGSVKRRCPNTGKLERLTGFKIKTDISKGLEEAAKWYKKYHEKNK